MPSLERRAAEIRRRFPDDPYTAYHARRYAFLVARLEDLAPIEGRILDVGRSRCTSLLHETFGAPVDNLGFDPEGPTPEGCSYRFDLNDAQHPDRWRTDLPPYSIVVLAEVLEHLYTAPSLVLRFVASLIEPGGRLVLQTPNALSLAKRVKPWLGIHPYERIRENPENPGHFREYTARELREDLEIAGLRVESTDFVHYFDFRYENHTGRRTGRRLGALKNGLYSLFPGRLKSGITVVARKG